MSATLQPAMSASDSAGDLYLSGSYLEVGISPWGNFGTQEGLTPAGYTEVGGAGVGLTYNAAGFGVPSSTPTIDFFTPGSPYEAVAAGFTQGGATQTGFNYKDGDVEGITAVSLTNTSSGSTLSAEWVGVLDGALRVTIDYTFGAADIDFTTHVTLTNISGAAMSDARYDRSVDPDNTVFAGGSYTTVNTVVSQRSDGSASEVTASSLPGDPYAEATGSPVTLLYYSNDPGTEVGFGNGTGVFSLDANAAGSTETADDQVFINYDAGPLAAGASAGFTYYTGMTNDPASIVSKVSVAPPVIAGLATGSDAGTSIADLAGTATADATPTVAGTGTAGDALTVSDGTTVLGTATVGADGTWTLAVPTPLAEGAHSLTATDASSGTTSAAFALAIDAPPAITGANGVNNHAGTDAAPVIAGTAAALTPIGSTISIRADGALVGTTVTTDAAGDWSYSPATPLSVAIHALTATETVGGVTSGASASYSYTQAPTAPTGPALRGMDAGALTNHASPTFTGRGTTGDTVTLFDGSTAIGSALVGADGTWSVTSSTLADGAHAITTTQTSVTGLVSSASAELAVTVDTVAPIVSIALGDDTGRSATDRLTQDAALRGTAEAGTTVTISEGGRALATVVAAADGSWSVAASQLGLADGAHTIAATDTDAAGNSSTVQLGFVLDTTPPDVSAGSASLLADTATPVLSGTAEDGATVAVLLDGQVLGTTTADATTGTWSYQVTTPIATGPHAVAAQATDAAGNVSAVSAAAALLVVPTPAASDGVSTAGLASLTFHQVVGQNFQMQFVSGTEAVQLADGTLSVGADTQQAYIARLYQTLLGRTADTPGITGWNADANTGASNAALASGFLGSAEGQAAVAGLSDTQFVDTLYQHALGRSAATTETAFWTHSLASGATRGEVLAAIADSPEAKKALAGDTGSVWVPDSDAQLVVFDYETAFGRAPEASGLQYWTQALKGGMSVSDFMTAFAASPEFKAAHGDQSASGLVTSLYENGLGRAPTGAELATYASALQKGAVTPANLLGMVATSHEAYLHLATNL